MGSPITDAMRWPQTDVSCSAIFCTEAIAYTEEICMLSVEVAAHTEQGLVCTPIVASDGDYLYEPVFYCHGYWKNILDELESYVADVPPIEDVHSLFECAACRSGIRAGEVFGKITPGEFQVSDRSPDGQVRPSFVPLIEIPVIVCAPCINVIQQDISEIWGDPLRQNNECAEGTHLRCWRHGCSADVDCNCISEEQE